MKYIYILIFSLALVTSCEIPNESKNYIEMAIQEQLNSVPDEIEYTTITVKDLEIVFHENNKLHILIFKDEKIVTRKEVNSEDTIEDDGFNWLYTEEPEIDLNLLIVYLRKDIDLPIIVNEKSVDKELIALKNNKVIYQVYDKPIILPIMVEIK